MIKANELRGFNWILKAGKPLHMDVYRFWEIHEAFVKCVDWLEDCEGIPLTPEVLEKCGFIKWEPQPGIIQYRWKDGKMTGEVDKEGVWAFNPGIGGYWIEKQFLHELQNLIFVLEGEELIFKP